MDEKNAYNTCNDAHNLGLTLLKTPSGEPGISCRWHTARDAYLDAIDLAMKKAPGSFLTTHGEDHRRLLSKIAVAMALLRLRVLDAPGLLAWGRVAVAADPTYFNGHSRVSSGLQHVGRYEEALAEARVAQELAEPEWKRKTSLGIAPLEKIVAGSKEEKKAAIMDFLEEKRRIAFSYWQEMGVSKPAKSCALCFWDAENKCARCRTVYYCQRECQKIDHPEHKHACVEAEGTVKQKYPKADYPNDELCSDEEWEEMLRSDRKPTPGIHLASKNCHIGAVKRALVEGEEVNSLFVAEYPIHLAALRLQPQAAADVISLLLRHGACPNVLRGDDRHLLELCRMRARWIDDESLTKEEMWNTVGDALRTPHRDGLENVEREESKNLVKLVTDAIQGHKMCKYCKPFCKGRKQAMAGAYGAFVQVRHDGPKQSRN